MIREKIISIIALVLEKKESEISLESNNSNLDNWGSVQNLFISSDIENEFGIDLSPDDISNFNSVLEIEKIIKKHKTQ
jgi:acyl carrier protein